MSANSTIALLKQLSELIAQPPVKVKTIAERLGAIQDDFQGQYTVNPEAPELESAFVMPLPDSEEPNFIRVTLKDGLPLDTLVEAFGDYRKTPPMPGEPSSGRFSLETESRTHTATILVPLDSDAPRTVTIRRDIRL